MKIMGKVSEEIIGSECNTQIPHKMWSNYLTQQAIIIATGEVVNSSNQRESQNRGGMQLLP